MSQRRNSGTSGGADIELNMSFTFLQGNEDDDSDESNNNNNNNNNNTSPVLALSSTNSNTNRSGTTSRGRSVSFSAAPDGTTTSSNTNSRRQVKRRSTSSGAGGGGDSDDLVRTASNLDANQSVENLVQELDDLEENETDFEIVYQGTAQALGMASLGTTKILRSKATITDMQGVDDALCLQEANATLRAEVSTIEKEAFDLRREASNFFIRENVLKGQLHSRKQAIGVLRTTLWQDLMQLRAQLDLVGRNKNAENAHSNEFTYLDAFKLLEEENDESAMQEGSKRIVEIMRIEFEMDKSRLKEGYDTKIAGLHAQIKRMADQVERAEKLERELGAKLNEVIQNADAEMSSRLKRVANDTKYEVEVVEKGYEYKLDGKDEEISELHLRIKEQEMELDSCREVISINEGNIQKIAGDKIRAAEQETITERLAKKEMEIEVDQAKQMLDKLKKETRDQQMIINTLKANEASLIDKLETITTAKKAIDTTRDATESQEQLALTDCQKQIDTLQDEMKTLKQENEEMSKRLHSQRKSAKTAAGATDEALAYYKDEVVNLGEEAKALRKQADDAHRRLDEAKLEAEQREAELKVSSQENASITGKMEILSERSKRDREALEELRTKIRPVGIFLQPVVSSLVPNIDFALDQLEFIARDNELHTATDFLDSIRRAANIITQRVTKGQLALMVERIVTQQQQQLSTASSLTTSPNSSHLVPPALSSSQLPAHKRRASRKSVVSVFSPLENAATTDEHQTLQVPGSNNNNATTTTTTVTEYRFPRVSNTIPLSKLLLFEFGELLENQVDFVDSEVETLEGAADEYVAEIRTKRAWEISQRQQEGNVEEGEEDNEWGYEFADCGDGASLTEDALSSLGGGAGASKFDLASVGDRSRSKATRKAKRKSTVPAYRKYIAPQRVVRGIHQHVQTYISWVNDGNVTVTFDAAEFGDDDDGTESSEEQEEEEQQQEHQLKKTLGRKRLSVLSLGELRDGSAAGADGGVPSPALELQRNIEAQFAALGAHVVPGTVSTPLHGSFSQKFDTVPPALSSYRDVSSHSVGVEAASSPIGFARSFSGAVTNERGVQTEEEGEDDYTYTTAAAVTRDCASSPLHSLPNDPHLLEPQVYGEPYSRPSSAGSGAAGGTQSPNRPPSAASNRGGGGGSGAGAPPLSPVTPQSLRSCFDMLPFNAQVDFVKSIEHEITGMVYSLPAGDFFEDLRRPPPVYSQESVAHALNYVQQGIAKIMQEAVMQPIQHPSTTGGRGGGGTTRGKATPPSDPLAESIVAKWFGAKPRHGSTGAAQPFAERGGNHSNDPLSGSGGAAQPMQLLDVMELRVLSLLESMAQVREHAEHVLSDKHKRQIFSHHQEKMSQSAAKARHLRALIDQHDVEPVEVSGVESRGSVSPQRTNNNNKGGQQQQEELPYHSAMGEGVRNAERGALVSRALRRSAHHRVPLVPVAVMDIGEQALAEIITIQNTTTSPAADTDNNNNSNRQYNNGNGSTMAASAQQTSANVVGVNGTVDMPMSQMQPIQLAQQNSEKLRDELLNAKKQKQHSGVSMYSGTQCAGYARDENKDPRPVAPSLVTGAIPIQQGRPGSGKQQQEPKLRQRPSSAAPALGASSSSCMTRPVFLASHEKEEETLVTLPPQNVFNVRLERRKNVPRMKKTTQQQQIQGSATGTTASTLQQQQQQQQQQRQQSNRGAVRAMNAARNRPSSATAAAQYGMLTQHKVQGSSTVPSRASSAQAVGDRSSHGHKNEDEQDTNVLGMTSVEVDESAVLSLSGGSRRALGDVGSVAFSLSSVTKA